MIDFSKMVWTTELQLPCDMKLSRSSDFEFRFIESLRYDIGYNIIIKNDAYSLTMTGKYVLRFGTCQYIDSHQLVLVLLILLLCLI